jgi:NitT/TauT family transport system substrate-binding protein
MVEQRFFKGFLLALLLAGVLWAGNVQAGDEKNASGQPLTAINVAQPGHDDYGIPLYLADKLGYFKEEGLEVKFVNFKSSPLSIASLLAGEVQFCLTSYDQALKTFEKGKTLKNILTTTDKHPWCLIARPEIKSVADLKGKSISAKMPGSGPRAFATSILINSGLDPDKDVVFVDLPETAIMPSYLNGGIDATVGSGIRKAEMLARGATVLVDMNDPAQHMAILKTDKFPLKVVLATGDYLKDNPETAQKFVNAVVRAIKWEETHSSKEIAEQVEPYFLGALNEGIIDDVRRAFSHTGLITAEGHQAIVEQSIGVGLITKPVAMENVVDMSYLEKALVQH